MGASRQRWGTGLYEAEASEWSCSAGLVSPCLPVSAEICARVVPLPDDPVLPSGQSCFSLGNMPRRPGKYSEFLFMVGAESGFQHCG